MKSTMLVNVDPASNHNKFYHVTLEDDGMTVTKRWGRVRKGAEVNLVAANTQTEMTGEKGYNRVINGKKRRGYAVAPVVTTDSATKKVEQSNLAEVARKALVMDMGSVDPQVLSMIDTLVAQNRHQIMQTSGGMIDVDTDGVIKTPLGIIDKASLSEAHTILCKIEKVPHGDNKEYLDLLKKYLTLVPQEVSSRRGWHQGFFDNGNMTKQFEFLEQLEKSYDWYEQMVKAAQSKQAAEAGKDTKVGDDLFRYKISLMDDTKEFARIRKFFDDNRNRAHSSSSLKLKRVYQLSSPLDDSNFAETSQALGNVHELWHGTMAANILSILSKGLFVPPTSGSSIRVTGRMFGNGVYFSNQSTKSLNYSQGYWQGTRQSHCFMFLADVVLGKECHPTRIGDQAAYRKTHDSIFVEPGLVRNNEVIVWNTKQIALRYLCEFDN